MTPRARARASCSASASRSWCVLLAVLLGRCNSKAEANRRCCPLAAATCCLLISPPVPAACLKPGQRSVSPSTAAADRAVPPHRQPSGHPCRRHWLRLPRDRLPIWPGEWCLSPADYAPPPPPARPTTRARLRACVPARSLNYLARRVAAWASGLSETTGAQGALFSSHLVDAQGDAVHQTEPAHLPAQAHPLSRHRFASVLQYRRITGTHTGAITGKGYAGWCGC